MSTTEQTIWTEKEDGRAKMLMRAAPILGDPVNYTLYVVHPVPKSPKENKPFIDYLMNRSRKWEKWLRRNGCEVAGPRSIHDLGPAYRDKYIYGIEIVAICPLPTEAAQEGLPMGD